MIGVALKGLLGRKLRAALTAFAIVLGVAMVSGSFVLTDTIGGSFDRLFEESYENADAVVSSADAPPGNVESSEDASFPASVRAEVERLPQVGSVLASVEDDARLVDRDGELIASRDNSVGFGVDTGGDLKLNPLTLVDGDWPSGESEIAIDKATSEDEGFVIGDSIRATVEGPMREYEVAGLVQFGSGGSLGGITIAVFDLPTAQRLFGKPDQLDEIQVSAADGVTPAELLRAIGPVLPKTAEVKSAEAQAASASEDVRSGLDIFKYFLLGFGGIALFVGSFVIANTLSITIAQRVRELATLRTLGASRWQVLWSVTLEALVVGLVASVVGLFGGLGIAKLLYVVMGVVGLELPESELVFATRTVVVSLLLGTAITLLASIRPALRATRVAPISAVREGAVLPKSRLARFGLPVALAVTAIGVALLSYGVFVSGVEIKTRLLSLVGGILFLFVGVTLVAPRLVRPLAAVVGWPGAKIGGVAGGLARDNATRSPERTATTAAALMIGLALIAFVSVLGQGLRTSFSDAVDELFVADYSLTAGDSPLSQSAVEAAGRAPGVTAISPIRDGQARVDGKSTSVNGVDADLAKVLDMRWHRGSDSVPAQLGDDGAFVKKDYAEDNALDLGSAIAIRTSTGARLEVKVEGVFEEPKGGSPFADVAISTALFDRSFADPENVFTLVNVEGGPSPANTERLENALADYPEAVVETRDEFKASQIANLEIGLNLLYGLLGLSVIVSLFGIVNTLVLTVFERTRELGMLRAIGMTRRQVRRMVRYESVVTALIGATLGIGVGVFLAALVTRALSSEGIVFAVPWTSFGVLIGLAVVAGILAAALPARRASRLNVLEALQYE
jgi:putative ABC transport system permease protein